MGGRVGNLPTARNSALSILLQLREKVCNAAAVGLVLIAGLVWSTVGCGKIRTQALKGKVTSFSGQLVHDGKPVTFSQDNEAVVDFFQAEDGIRFGVPIKADGSFSIGWMPVGKHSLVYERFSKTGGVSAKSAVPGGLTIEAGKTSGYVIELGKSFKRDMKAPDEGPKTNKYKG